MQPMDGHAFADLVARHHVPFVRLARSFVHDDFTAEEVVQDAWLAALAGLPRPEGGSITSWLCRVVVNIAKTRGVRQRRAVTSSDEVVDREAVEAARRELWRLPETQRAVIVLRDLVGLDVLEVCRMLDVTEVSLRVLHQRARARLRRVVERDAA
jgi:RNA polymerase sigma-70 factor, ECF subfamily